MSKAKECYCGARIVRATLPDDHPELIKAWGRKTWWKDDRGGAMCYPDADGRDAEARHEPYQDWEDE